MIKVIASDMDGTLLGDDHKIAPQTLEAIREACDTGIRFMVVTGRNFRGAMQELEGAELICDYILGSGAEVRNSAQEVVSHISMEYSVCKEIHEILKDYPVSTLYMSDLADYMVGTPEEIKEGFFRHMHLFFTDIPVEELEDSEIYRQLKGCTESAADVSELEAKQIPLYKIFLSSEDVNVLGQIREKLESIAGIAVASSFWNNLEITDERAQKGPVLQAYIESLGYSMDEVMVLGDSMNDYSMLSMDFGATVAMENSEPEVKQIAKYVTRSNEEFGVAYAIRELLKRQPQG